MELDFGSIWSWSFVRIDSGSGKRRPDTQLELDNKANIFHHYLEEFEFVAFRIVVSVSLTNL